MLKRSQFFVLCVVWSTYTVGNIRSFGVGIMYNASFTIPYFDTAMNVSSCNQCLCAMFPPSMNSSILSLNCIVENPHGIICELFNQTITLASNSSQIKINLRSTFHFRLLTVIGQSEPTSAPRVTTQEGAYFIYHTRAVFRSVLVDLGGAQCFISSNFSDWFVALLFEWTLFQREFERPRPYVP